MSADKQPRVPSMAVLHFLEVVEESVTQPLDLAIAVTFVMVRIEELDIEHRPSVQQEELHEEIHLEF